MKQYYCRFCNQPLPEAILKLPNTPIANEFLNKAKNQEAFPLQLTSCSNCHLYQLNYSVPAEILFNEGYTFVSGTSPVNQKYFRQYAEDTISRFNLKPGDFIIEVASNDATLLKVFKEKGMKVLGIDPASSIAKKATEEGVETIGNFFTEKLADKIATKYGKAKIIICNNMLAHIDNVNDIIRGVRKLLDKNAVFIFENSYFLSMYKHNLFDILYHEHKSYPLVFPMQVLFNQNEMCLFDVLETSPHGGSIRGFASKEFKTSETVDLLIKQERDLGLISKGDKDIKINNWKNKINKLGEELRNKIKEYKLQNKKIDIFGYPAKLTTLLYTFGIEKGTFRYAYDDNILKNNVFSPGLNIPVLNPKEIINNNPDVILIGAWNFAPSIIEKCKSMGYNGKFIVPLPEFKVIE